MSIVTLWPPSPLETLLLFLLHCSREDSIFSPQMREYGRHTDDVSDPSDAVDCGIFTYLGLIA